MADSSFTYFSFGNIFMNEYPIIQGHDIPEYDKIHSLFMTPHIFFDESTGHNASQILSQHEYFDEIPETIISISPISSSSNSSESDEITLPKSQYKRLDLPPSYFANGCICGHLCEFRDINFHTPFPQGNDKAHIPPVTIKLRTI